MFIMQISVFLENTTGALRELTGVLGENYVDIRELSVADTQNFGIVRMIIRSDEIDRSMEILRNAGYTARKNHVICAEIADAPNSLSALLAAVERAGISVE